VVPPSPARPEEATVAELTTQPTGDDIESFLAAIPDERRRGDARAVCVLLARVTGEPAVMWGKAIVGFAVNTSATTAAANSSPKTATTNPPAQLSTVDTCSVFSRR
jgi:hypothetical protein